MRFYAGLRILTMRRPTGLALTMNSGLTSTVFPLGEFLHYLSSFFFSVRVLQLWHAWIRTLVDVEVEHLKLFSFSRILNWFCYGVPTCFICGNKLLVERIWIQKSGADALPALLILWFLLLLLLSLPLLPLLLFTFCKYDFFCVDFHRLTTVTFIFVTTFDLAFLSVHCSFFGNLMFMNLLNHSYNCYPIKWITVMH